MFDNQLAQCETKEYIGRSRRPTLLESLNDRRISLEYELEKVNSAISALNAAPEAVEARMRERLRPLLLSMAEEGKRAMPGLSEYMATIPNAVPPTREEWLAFLNNMESKMLGEKPTP